MVVFPSEFLVLFANKFSSPNFEIPGKGVNLNKSLCPWLIPLVLEVSLVNPSSLVSPWLIEPSLSFIFFHYKFILI